MQKTASQGLRETIAEAATIAGPIEYAARMLSMAESALASEDVHRAKLYIGAANIALDMPLPTIHTAERTAS